jgi:hypothetical protein
MLLKQAPLVDDGIADYPEAPTFLVSITSGAQLSTYRLTSSSSP